MIKLLLPILVLCAPGFFIDSLGQNFQPGFIIDLKGDTIKGQIDYKRWDRNPKSITFRQEVQTSTFHPNEIQSFSVESENYQSAIVDVDVSPYKPNDLTQSPEPEYKRDTVFLQSVFQGKKNLFFLKDRNAKKHFYILDNGFEPLVYKQYVKYNSGGSAKGILDNTKYKSQLAIFFKDCPDIQPRIERTTYDANSMIKLFTYYHECTNQSIQYSNEHKEAKVEFGILAGATISNLNFDGPDEYQYVVDSRYEASLTPSLGFYLDLKLLRSKGLSITNDLFYSSFDIKGNVTPANGTNEINSTFQFQYIKTHHQLRVDVLKNKKIYLGAGVSTGIAIKDEVDILLVSPSIRYFTTKDFEFGLLTTAGTQLGKLSTEIKFEISNGVSGFPNLTSRTKRAHFFLKYRLSK